MLIIANPEDIKDTGAKGTIDGKQKDLFFVVNTNATNIVDVITRFEGYKHVVGYIYLGDPTVIPQIADLKSKPVLFWQEAQTLDVNTDMIMSGLDPRLRVVFQLPQDYHDMRTIMEYSSKYPNLYVEGGYFIHLEGCHLGGIQESDLPKKIPVFGHKLVTRGVASPYPFTTLDSIEDVEFFTAKVKLPKIPKEPKPKKEPNQQKVKKPKQASSGTGAKAGTSKAKAKSKVNKNKRVLQNLFGI